MFEPSGVKLTESGRKVMVVLEALMCRERELRELTAKYDALVTKCAGITPQPKLVKAGRHGLRT